MFELWFTPSAQAAFDAVKADASKTGLLKQLYKTFGFLQSNLRHPSLKTHEFHGIPHPFVKGEKVFEAYAQNQTPGAYRVFWCYGPEKNQITVIAIAPHP